MNRRVMQGCVTEMLCICNTIVRDIEIAGVMLLNEVMSMKLCDNVLLSYLKE